MKECDTAPKLGIGLALVVDVMLHAACTGLNTILIQIRYTRNERMGGGAMVAFIVIVDQ